MHPFVETISVAGAIGAVIVAAIVLLTLFFRGMSWISRAGSKPETIAIRGVLKKDSFATVHLTGGETFERVRFVGFTRSETSKPHLPFELRGMVILEDEGGTRFLVRARSIRLIVVAPDTTEE